MRAGRVYFGREVKAVRREVEIEDRRWDRMVVVREGVEEGWMGVGMVVETSVCTRTRVSIVV